jgi:glycolate oxidase FAD binding subunit
MSAALAPAEEDGIVAALAAAHDDGVPLEILGRGSKRGMLRPVQAARGLSLAAHAGITLHSPRCVITCSACAR